MNVSKVLALKLKIVETTWNCSGIFCALLGHDVDMLSWHNCSACCRRCATPFLSTREGDTRIGHVVSCFLFGHNYHLMGTRDGHNEYVCSRCGHPLLFAIAHDPYRECFVFKKKVRYLCNLFGHKVHQLTNRSSFTEYACDCGHSFLKRRTGMVVVKHPLVCFLAGHFVRFVEMRNGYAEFFCRNCGHTFCFGEKQ